VTTTNYFNVEVMSVTVIGMMADTFFYPFGTKCLVGLKKEKNGMMGRKNTIGALRMPKFLPLAEQC